MTPDPAGRPVERREDEDEKFARPRWSRWYADARAEMEFRYALRRIPVDFYKTQYSLGDTPQQAAKNIYNWMQATDHPRQR